MSQRKLKAYIEPAVLKKEDYMDLIRAALKEDKAENDITTFSIFDESRTCEANLIAKEEGVLAGMEIFCEVFKALDSDIQLEVKQKDGGHVQKGDVLCILKGRVRSILAGERTALNFLSMLSGMASAARQAAEILSPLGITPLDTRKTLPGFRSLSKYAVQTGGGANHRNDLEQMGLIKDNHIAAVKSVSKSIELFKKQYPGKKLEVEVDTFDQLTQALPCNPDMVLLDNMSPELLQKCVREIQKYNRENNTQILTEASGGYSLENLHTLEGTGVDFVSMGSLTNRIKPVDFSLDIPSDR